MATYLVSTYKIYPDESPTMGKESFQGTEQEPENQKLYEI